MDEPVSRVLVNALLLLNDAPRFGLRARVRGFDSYVVAKQIEDLLQAHGVKPPPDGRKPWTGEDRISP